MIRTINSIPNRNREYKKTSRQSGLLIFRQYGISRRYGTPISEFHSESVSSTG